VNDRTQEALAAKGAQFAGTVVGGKVDGRDAEKVYPMFWSRAAGNPDPLTGIQKLVLLPDALEEAVRYRNSERGGYFSFSPQGVEHGTGGPYRAYSRGGGSLTPAHGGKRDEELKAMGALP